MKLKRGDVREDGMVFWEYGKKSKNGEYWVTRENFEVKRENQKEEQRKSRAENPEKCKERTRKYRAENPEKRKEEARKSYAKNAEKIKEQVRKSQLRKSFAKYDGSSYESWIKSLTRPLKTFAALDTLTPSPNQTLAELIHEISGYPMATCEAIANPPAPETETEIETTNEMKEELF